jgi:hypothetical protein
MSLGYGAEGMIGARTNPTVINGVNSGFSNTGNFILHRMRPFQDTHQFFYNAALPYKISKIPSDT